MPTRGGSIVRDDIVLEPAFYITGHRGRKHLWAVCEDRMAADQVCRVYQRLGYVHLRLHRVHVSTAEDWQPWRAVHQPAEAFNG